jgi:hypothetical protein
MRKKVVVHDKMQRGYVYYRTEPVGRNFAPAFTPELTPKQMLRLGVFGGKYMTDCRPEFPRSWFTHAKLCATRHDARQIRRWRAIGRHVMAIQKNCDKRDLECRRKQRQAALHWAYDSRRI